MVGASHNIQVNEPGIPPLTIEFVVQVDLDNRLVHRIVYVNAQFCLTLGCFGAFLYPRQA